MHDSNDYIRELIREILETVSVDETSVVANISPILPIPLGMTTGSSILNKRGRKGKGRNSKRSKKLSEGFGLTLHNLIRYEVSYDEYEFEEVESYYEALNKLLSSFGGSENPFGSSRKNALKNVEKYLKGHLNYPHGT